MTMYNQYCCDVMLHDTWNEFHVHDDSDSATWSNWKTIQRVNVVVYKAIVIYGGILINVS